MKARSAAVAFLLTLLFCPQFILSAEKENLKIKVKGMRCSSRVSVIRRSVQKISNVESVRVDHSQVTPPRSHPVFHITHRTEVP